MLYISRFCNLGLGKVVLDFFTDGMIKFNKSTVWGNTIFLDNVTSKLDNWAVSRYI